MGKVCYDHLGNKFNSYTEMCKYYGVRETAFFSRLNKGLTIKDALEFEDSHICYDHLGNKFKNKKEMCEHYGISYVSLHRRISSGMSLGEALEKRCIVKGCCDHLGNRFSSKNEMCKHYGIKLSTLKYRLNSGMSLKDALTTEVDTFYSVGCCDHLGNKFQSQTKMCEHYGIERRTFEYRIKNGWSLKDALCTNVANEYYNGCCDHLGNKFKSREEMCDYYGIKKSTFRYRISIKFTLAEALGTRGRGIELSIKSNEVVNTHIDNIEKAYTGLDNNVYYTCIDRKTSEELLLNADEILMYKQKDYKTAVEQLIARRRGVHNG